MHESRWVILFKIHCVLWLTLCLKHDRKGIFDLLNDNPDYGDMCGYRVWRAGMKRRREQGQRRSKAPAEASKSRAGGTS